MTSNDDNLSRAAGSAAELRIRRMGAYVAAIFLGGLAGLTVVVWILAQRGPGELPPLSAAAHDAAFARWQQAGLASYELEVSVHGRDSDTYQVVVRGGDVQEAYRNGQRLKQQRTWGTWSVPGMFETLDRDLSVAKQQAAGTTAVSSPQLLLRGEFDPVWGYPRRYQRTEVRKFGDNYEVRWEVTQFHARDGSEPAASPDISPTDPRVVPPP